MRTYEQAKAYAMREAENPSKNWYRQCQMFARQCVGAPPFGASARLAFNGTPPRARHLGTPPPPGSLAYYGLEDRGAGHAVFVVDGGFVWSTDIGGRGRVGRVQWNWFPTHWNGMPYRGWIDRCPDGELPLACRPGERPTYKQQKKVYASKMRFKQVDSDSVWNLQLALMAKGYSVGAGPTGTFGLHTMIACAAFQGARGWKGRQADGIPGKLTVRALGLVWVDD